MFVVPDECYYKDDSKVNLTVQALWEAVVKDLNALAEHGLEDPKSGEPCLQIVGVKMFIFFEYIQVVFLLYFPCQTTQLRRPTTSTLSV